LLGGLSELHPGKAGAWAYPKCFKKKKGKIQISDKKTSVTETNQFFAQGIADGGLGRAQQIKGTRGGQSRTQKDTAGYL